MTHDIIVEKDKYLNLIALYQERTYAGLLEGLPTDRMNKRILEGLPDKIKKHFDSYTPFYVIPPEETPIPYKGKYAFGTPVSLPYVMCMAELSYHRPVNQTNKDGSVLNIVWFQNTFVFPIEETIQKKLLEFQWSKYALDIDY